MISLFLSIICVLLAIFTGENNSIRARVIVLGDPDWIQEVSVLLYNLFDDTCCMAHVTRSDCNWWAYWTKCTSTRSASASSLQGKDPVMLGSVGVGCAFLLPHVGVLSRVCMKESVPKFENFSLSSLNKQMILLLQPQSFEDDALQLTNVKVYLTL